MPRGKQKKASVRRNEWRLAPATVYIYPEERTLSFVQIEGFRFEVFVLDRYDTITCMCDVLWDPVVLNLLVNV